MTIKTTGLFTATNASPITNTASTQIISAPPAGANRYITSISIVNDSLTATRVDILDGTTIVYRFRATNTNNPTLVFNPPIRISGNLNAQCASTGSSIFVSVSGFIDL
jgi:hypothetical protein